MKKILRELKRIFPDRFVSIKLDMNIDRIGIFEEEYQAYISGFSFGEYDISDDFETLEELDKYLYEKLGTYKRQIK